MSCPIDQLPLLLYGDLTEAEAATVNRHVAECASCRDALAALQSVRAALHATPVPDVNVAPAQIFLASAQPQRRRWVPWMITGALAASLVALAVWNLEVSIGRGQMIVRWGQPLEVVLGHNVGMPAADNSAMVALEERVRLLQELTHALARDVERRDRQRSNDVQRTLAQLETQMQTTGLRLGETQRDVDALYAAHFKASESGGKP